MPLSDDDLNKIATLINTALDARDVASKSDLKGLLTKDEFDKQYNILLQNIVTNGTFDERIKQAIDEVFDEKIKNLPTKEEFFCSHG